LKSSGCSRVIEDVDLFDQRPARDSQRNSRRLLGRALLTNQLPANCAGKINQPSSYEFKSSLTNRVRDARPAFELERA
jgi:hypothetical protein